MTQKTASTLSDVGLLDKNSSEKIQNSKDIGPINSDKKMVECSFQKIDLYNIEPTN